MRSHKKIPIVIFLLIKSIAIGINNLEPEDVNEMDCRGWHTSTSLLGLIYAISRNELKERL